MQLSVNALQIRKRHFLLEDHLVECGDEVGIQESPMEDTKTQASSNKFEVIQVLRVDTRRRINLEGIVIVRGVLEETVEGVKHLM